MRNAIREMMRMRLRIEYNYYILSLLRIIALVKIIITLWVYIWNNWLLVECTTEQRWLFFDFLLRKKRLSTDWVPVAIDQRPDSNVLRDSKVLEYWKTIIDQYAAFIADADNQNVINGNINAWRLLICEKKCWNRTTRSCVLSFNYWLVGACRKRKSEENYWSPSYFNLSKCVACTHRRWHHLRAHVLNFY